MLVYQTLPLFTVVAASIFLNEKFKFVSIPCIIISLTGIYLLNMEEDTSGAKN